MGLCSLVATPVAEENTMVTITLSREDYRAITALINKELKMHEAADAAPVQLDIFDITD